MVCWFLTDGCPNGCNKHGSCQLFLVGWTCICHDGWKGSGCEVAMEEECDNSLDDDGGFTIHFLLGFYLFVIIDNINYTVRRQNSTCLEEVAKFQRFFPNPSWLTSGRTSGHQKLIPTFPWMNIITERVKGSIFWNPGGYWGAITSWHLGVVCFCSVY